MDIRRPPRSRRRRVLLLSGAALVLVLVTFLLGSLGPADPTVERGTLWIDTVKRGPMIRQVRGAGSLVPERIRWVTTLTAGRVERIFAEPGADLEEQTVLLELSNPDVELQSLEAERQVAAAEAGLVDLEALLETQRLAQEGTIAASRSESREAERKAHTDEELVKKGLIAALTQLRSQDRAEELGRRLEIEEQRLGVLTDAAEAQIQAQRSQVDRLRAILEFRRRQVESMRVQAGAAGMLQELPVEVGQWVAPGATLAKVIEPGRLKAVLRIPQTQAKDLTLGQAATIDARVGIIEGRVARIDPAAQNGTVTVDVSLQGSLPQGARPDLTVDGTIDIERLENVLFVGRPVEGQPHAVLSLFRLERDGRSAHKVRVRLGRVSVGAVEIVEGLQEDDLVILSDLSRWPDAERIRLR